MSRVLCLDTSVIISYLVPDEDEAAADALVWEAIAGTARLVAPAFLWTEVGSVLRKKLRRDLLTPEQAQGCYEDFCELPINYINEETVRRRAWEIARQHGLPTLYDAAFLACAEQEAAQFWTADTVLLKQLSPRPSFVHQLVV